MLSVSPLASKMVRGIFCSQVTQHAKKGIMGMFRLSRQDLS
jgi:hypothetical protein